jgi:hypothetical protein
MTNIKYLNGYLAVITLLLDLRIDYYEGEFNGGSYRRKCNRDDSRAV